MTDKDEPEPQAPRKDVERRRSDRRTGEDRRKKDLGLPQGIERRTGRRRKGDRRRA